MSTARATKAAKQTPPRPGAGGFRHTDLGQMIREKRHAAAAKELRRLMQKHHTVAAIARHLEVDRTSVERWFRRLAQAGHDPRATAEKTAA
jgi:hypothetical protein